MSVRLPAVRPIVWDEPASDFVPAASGNAVFGRRPSGICCGGEPFATADESTVFDSSFVCLFCVIVTAAFSGLNRGGSFNRGGCRFFFSALATLPAELSATFGTVGAAGRAGSPDCASVRAVAGCEGRSASPDDPVGASSASRRSVLLTFA